MRRALYQKTGKTSIRLQEFDESVPDQTDNLQTMLLTIQNPLL